LEEILRLGIAGRFVGAEKVIQRWMAVCLLLQAV